MSIEITEDNNTFYDTLYKDVEELYNKYSLKNKELKRYKVDVENHSYFFAIQIEQNSNINCCYQRSKNKGKIKILDNKYYFIEDTKFGFKKVDFENNKDKIIKIKILDEFNREYSDYKVKFVDFPDVFEDSQLLLRIIVYKNIKEEIKKLKDVII